MNLRFNKYMVVALLSLNIGVLSCSKNFTDLTPQGSITDANYWKTETDAIFAANGLYQHFSDDNMFGRGLFWYVNASDDMVTGRTDAGSAAVRNFTATGQESRVNSMYKKFYEIVQRANTILTKVPPMEIGEETKQRVLGEAYFMRGYAYFYLAQYYGDQRAGVPIVTEENMLETRFSRPGHVNENFVQMEKDLLKAAELLPLLTTYGADDLGRANKDAAYAYLAKMNLQWARYDASKWLEVVKYCDMVTNSGSGRKLIDTDNPSADFASVFYVENNYSSEYIFSVVSNRTRGSILPGVLFENTGYGLYNGWGYFHPSLELYNSFETGDHRKKATILEFNDPFTLFGEERRYFSSNSQTGFQFNKYMQPFRTPKDQHLNPNGDYPTSDLNIPLVRYADILLMKAEALIEQGQNGDAEINQVRNRAGLPAIQGATLADLKRERRSEFAAEYTDRHSDLVRWGDAKAAYEKAATGRQYAVKNDPTSAFTIVEVWPARNFDPSIHHVWPIPPQDLSNAGIAQNEGW
ncbi:RagB/SusD family nutrient uptake outer membrane protein [Sphingobacterium alkalisoli]|uniref:RagB/SusD family nutrient uptake outer membrane protein n=1 Tax=Sphingobacterium alkalisoli TaxID=1874115 RepID=A0A4U0GVW9_9SPHI|nr:RagB/SusD family nutrient uptake outer membrane protein [Sphingobacterium alkalisoli]TJY62744.1 RagB/SusD family nutrient uptake outer membrane protein [Sphingobacterium alkalisoli]GGH28628.1 membrane protein [Sphingobacterium alkalisoli]